MQIKKAIDMAGILGWDTVFASVRYGLRKKFIDRRYGRVSPRGPYSEIGAVTSIQKHERGVIITCKQGAIRLTVITPDCIQVRASRDGKFPIPFSYAVVKVSWSDVQFSVNETEDHVLLTTPELRCRVDRKDGKLTITNRRQQMVYQDAQPICWRTDEFLLSRQLPADELVLGLAGQPTDMNLRGRRYILWNTDPVGTARNKIPSYFTIPFYLGVRPDQVIGFFWDNTSRGWVDIGKHNTSALSFAGTAGELRYYIFSGPDINTVLQRYTELTGRMALPPVWALGLHTSRWSYYPADQVREIATGFRSHRMPCDVIYLDIHYMDSYRCFTWDRTGFSAPALLIKELADQGFRTVAILDPGIKVDANYPVYQSGQRDQLFLKLPNNKLFIAPCWAADSAFPDFTNPRTRAWWASLVNEHLLKAGIQGIWNDMNEPVVFNFLNDTEMPESVRHDFEGTGSTHLEQHNVYGLLMARATREALDKHTGGKRPFNIVRAAHAGVQRYASSWTGDNASDWDHLQLSISMSINSGLSGLAFTGPDIGGFGGDTEAELFTRWIQLGVFMPFYRIHTAINTRMQEPWTFGQPYEDIARKYIEMRYQLLPYLYSLFAQNAQKGWPIIRPMLMADPQDMRLYGIEDQFMVGEALLVAPILEKGKVERDVILPAGRWYDFLTNRPYEGGKKITVKAPLDIIPIFVRSGQVIPIWPIQQYVGERSIDELGLKIYAGNGDITLYEDAGEGNSYLEGNYRWLYFTTKQLPNGSFTIDWRRAGKYAPTYERVRCEVYGITLEPSDVQLDGASAPLWYFEKGVVEFPANKAFNNARIIIPERDERTIMRSPLKNS